MECSTKNMDGEELQNHHEALKFIEKDPHFIQAKEATVEGEDDEYNLFICVVIFNYYVL
jgi:hypothetical protein